MNVAVLVWLGHRVLDPKPPPNIRISRRIFAAVNPPKKSDIWIKIEVNNNKTHKSLCECDLAELLLNNLNCVDWLRYFVWYTNIDFMHYTVLGGLHCSAS